MKKELSLNVLIAIVIIGLSFVYSAMHWNFVLPFGTVNEHIEKQISITGGSYPDQPDIQSRILFPYLARIFFVLSNRPFWTVFPAEAICAAFSFFALFLLSVVFIHDKRYSILSVISFAFFTPYALQMNQRYGELLIFGFYAALLVCVLRGKYFLYILFLILASLQRPDIAVASVFFKITHSFFIKKKHGQAILDLAYFFIPIGVFLLISRVYGFTSAAYKSAYVQWLFVRPIENMKFLRFIILMYFPLVALSFWAFRYFGRELKLVILSLIPYLLMLVFLSSFAESRLLFPLFIILNIGIIKAVKDSGILDSQINKGGF